MHGKHGILTAVHSESCGCIKSDEKWSGVFFFRCVFGVLNTIALNRFFQKIRVQYGLEMACTPYTFRKSRYIAILKFSCLLYVGSAHSL